MVVIVLWKCRECCYTVDEAVKKYEKQHFHGIAPEHHPKSLTPEMLLKVAMQLGFEQSLTLVETDFTMVRISINQYILLLTLKNRCTLQGMHLQAQTKLSKDLKTHKYSAGVNGASADSVADASKLLHQLLEVT
ncbi:MAG: hypothetical protein HC767_01520 [Akkermansiaceae bacterium]|nr:hypothetical protein [Akkermansiaceae bacterium]